MSRPLMVVGFVFLFALIIINNLFADVSLLWLLVLLALSLLTIPLLIKKKGILASVVCLTVTAAYIMMYVFTVTEYKPALRFEGNGRTVVAEAVDFPKENISGMSCNMRIKEIAGQDVNIKTIAYFSKTFELKPYETYTFKADLKGVSSEKETDRYYKSEGIYLIASVEDKAQYLSSRNNISRFFSNIKKIFSERINDNLTSDVSAFVNAIFLGDRSFMEDEMLDAFNITGTSHILAVSGLHMSIWVLSFYKFLRKLAVNEKIASIFGIALYFLLFMLIGFRYSVVRSGIMLVVMLGANFFERDYDSKSSLGLAVLIICMMNPFSAMNNGFLMSVFATLGILVVYPDLLDFITRPIANRHGFFANVLKGMLSTIAVTLSASIMLIPIYIFSIKSFPIIAIIANLLIISLSTIVMVFGAGVGIFGEVNILSDIFSLIVQYIGKFVLFIINKLAEIPFASINVSNSFFKVWLVVALVICATTLIFLADKKRRLKVNAILCSFAFVLSYATFYTIEQNVTKVDLLTKNQGFAVIVRQEDTCVVIDYSGSVRTYKAVKNFLQREFVDNIDFLVCDSDAKILKLNDKIGEKVFMDKSKSFSLTIKNTISVNYYEQYRKSIYVEVGDLCAVITPDTRTDYNQLPLYMKSAHLLVCNNSVPTNFKTEKYRSIMVSEKTNKDRTADVLYKNAYSTAKMSAISHRSTDDGNYEIRRAY